MSTYSLSRGGWLLLITVLLALVTTVQPCAAAESVGLGEALSSGDGGIDFRLRYEFVNADNLSNNSNALTLRTALSYRTQRWKGFDFFLEAVNVSAADDASYATGPGPYSNGIDNRPVVPDPELTLFTQVYLGFESAGTRARLGTQEINLDDQRFIGGVGWRQNHQRFESFRLSNNSLAKATFNVVAMSRVHRITGVSQGMTTFLLNGKYDFSKAVALTLYAYMIDFDLQSLWGASTATFGGRANGSFSVGSFNVPYEAQFAHQTDFATNPDTLSQNYTHLMAGLRRWGVKLRKT